DDNASDFFHQRCEAMLKILTSVTGDVMATMEKALHAITGEDI
ncbi:hypothetical protein Pgy4_36420, partial [Pseudomonas savastanoi pv. glycinea str. race 4]